jgi:uncharacterized protein (TIGR02266 family)
MTYSGANQAKEARVALGQALEALQQAANIPEDVLAVAQNIAQSVSALFEAERASSEPDGKACVRNALGSLSQTLALLQDVRGEHPGVKIATEVIATSMSKLYPLTTVPSKAPQPMPAAAPAAGWANAAQPSPVNIPQTSPQPIQQPAPVAAVSAPIAPTRQPTPSPVSPANAPHAFGAQAPRIAVEANIGATTESNFYVGFSGEIAEGGVFLSTYEVLARGTPVDVLVTLPGGFETRIQGHVHFVRDPMDFSSDAEPGMGIRFEALKADQRELILRFIRKRPPVFYDD